MVRDSNSQNTIDIFKVGSALTKIQSFSPSLNEVTIGSFSPTTHHVSLLSRGGFHIFDVRNSKFLLHQLNFFPFHSFSPDGNLFAATEESTVHIWKYGSGCYTKWREFMCQDKPNSALQFSPTPSSILGSSTDILQVWRLHELPRIPETRRQQYVGLSRSGTRTATGYMWESTITITDFHAQSPPQFIDTGVRIEGLVLTGNILLVAGSGKLVAWLLTEEGLVDGVIGGRRVDRSDGIWDIPLSLYPWMFHVDGQVGVIRLHGGALHAYNTETGEVLHHSQAPQHYGDCWDHFDHALWGRDYLCYHNLSQCNTPLKDSWQTSRATLREGWVKDPEGKHRLWVPVEWRTYWDSVDWRHDVAIQFSYLGGRHVLIKF